MFYEKALDERMLLALQVFVGELPTQLETYVVELSRKQEENVNAMMRLRLKLLEVIQKNTSRK